MSNEELKIKILENELSDLEAKELRIRNHKLNIISKIDRIKDSINTKNNKEANDSKLSTSNVFQN